MTDLPSLLGALQAAGVRFIVVGGIAGIAERVSAFVESAVARV